MSDSSSTLKRHQVIGLALLLLMLALTPRLWGLGELGLYGDEETTSFPARAFASGEGPRMPTGMYYFRGIVLTALNAASATVFGIDREFSYRLPAALLGSLTIPIVFLLARRLWGDSIAFCAGSMLALSEWHIAMSREARMYAPFVMCFCACGLLIWVYQRFGRGWAFWTSVAVFFLGVGFHTLIRTAPLLFFIPALVAERDRRSYLLGTLSFVLVTWAQFISFCLILAPYRGWTVAARIGGDTSVWCGFKDWGKIIIPNIFFTAALLGLMHYFGAERLLSALRRLTHVSLYVLIVATLLLGHFYATLLIVMMLIAFDPQQFHWLLRRRPWMALALIAVGALHLVLGIVRADGGLKQAIVSTVRGTIDATSRFDFLPASPFPYLLHFHEVAGLLGLLFVVCVMAMALRPAEVPWWTRGAVFAVVVPLVVAGLGSNWNARYLAGAFPFLAIVVAWGLVGFSRWAMRTVGIHRPLAGPALGAAIVASGLLGVGIPQTVRAATLNYGDSLSQLIYAHPSYPDHASAGIFLRHARCEGDTIVAEDALQQRWYAGPIDYWLRNPDTHDEWIYEAEDGSFRDIYVDSELPTMERLRQLQAQPLDQGTVWLVSSAESYGHWEFGLDPERLDWLMSIFDGLEPVSIGRDGDRTRVYCLNCRPGEEPRSCDMRSGGSASR